MSATWPPRARRVSGGAGVREEARCAAGAACSTDNCTTLHTAGKMNRSTLHAAFRN